MSSKANGRTFTIVTLIVSAAYFASVCLYLSAHRMMWADEFLAWHLLADPSWRHALKSWNLAADSGGVLFYVVGRGILSITGLHPLAIRLYSSFCFWLAAVVWTKILRRYLPVGLALLTAAFTFLCNPEFIDQAVQVRFYGQLILAVCTAIYGALWLRDRRPTIAQAFAVSWIGGLFLITSHMLGVVYSAAILLAQMLSETSAQIRLAVFSGTVLSWATILLFHRALSSGAHSMNWIGMPSFMALVHFYSNHPLLLAPERWLSVLVNLSLLCSCLLAIVSFIRNFDSRDRQPSSQALMFYIAIAFLLAPVAFYVVSHLYKPLFTGRYILPYSLGLGFLAAFGIWNLAQRLPISSLIPLTYLAGIATAMIAFLTFKQQYVLPISNLEPALKLAQLGPVVLQDDSTVLQAHFYAPSRSKNLVYVMLHPRHGEDASLYAVVAQGYEPELVFDDSFLDAHRQFFYVNSDVQPRFFDEDLRDNPVWTHRKVGVLTINGISQPVFLYTRAQNDSAPTSP